MLALLSRELDLQLDSTPTTTTTTTTTTATTKAITTTTKEFQEVKTEAISITEQVKTENNTTDEMSIANDAYLDEVIDEIVDEHFNENFVSLTDFMDEDIEVCRRMVMCVKYSKELYYIQKLYCADYYNAISLITELGK